MEYAAYTVQGDTVTLYRLYGTGPVADVPDRIDGKRVEILADHLFAGEMSAFVRLEELSLARLSGDSWVKVEEEEVIDPEEEDSPRLSAAPGAGISPRVINSHRPDGIMGFPERRNEEALCGDRVQEIRIPEGVKQIGNYAFYGLYQLREIRFPSTVQKIGWGMFNGCRKVNRLVFNLKKDAKEKPDNSGWPAQTPPILKEILDCVPNEIEVIVRELNFVPGCDARQHRRVTEFASENNKSSSRTERWEEKNTELYRLRFPAYYEEGKENTPARIIEIIYHGTGHQYRNCFLNRVLQFDRYDEIFPLAAAQESPVTNVHLILNRLLSGPAPKEEIRTRYLEYLRKENGTMMDEILSDPELEPEKVLVNLDNMAYFASALLDESIQIASGRKNSRAVSCLMEIRSREQTSPADRRKGRYQL